MQLSPELQKKVKTIAHRYGHGWDGDDLTQDCLCLLCQLPESKTRQALTICRNLCIDKLRSEAVRACESLKFEPLLYGEAVDVEKYIQHIHNLRLRSVVDQFVDGKVTPSHKDRMSNYSQTTLKALAYIHINKSEDNMPKALEKLKLKCPECGSSQIYTLASNLRVCRRCNHRWHPVQTKKDSKE